MKCYISPTLLTTLLSQVGNGRKNILKGKDNQGSTVPVDGEGSKLLLISLEFNRVAIDIEDGEIKLEERQ